MKSVNELRVVSNLTIARSRVRSAALTAQECLTVWTTESWLSAVMLLWATTSQALGRAATTGAELESPASAEV